MITVAPGSVVGDPCGIGVGGKVAGGYRSSKSFTKVGKKRKKRES